MSESDSDDESLKSIRPGSTLSDSSTGLQISDCMKIRKAIRAMEKLEFELTTHMKSLVYSQAKGDMASIPKIEKKIKTNQEEKECKVSELRTLPPCLDANCPDHTFLSPINPVPNSSKTKIQSQKRKNEKEDSEGFAFPKKTARPITPTKALEPLQTQNNFETLTQDPEPVINMTNENDPPKPRAPNPITLKVSKNYREQIKMINETFPDIQIKTAGEYFKLFPNNVDQSRSLTQFLESDNQYQFYTIPLTENKPLKVVIKGLPRVTLPEEITIDLEELGFTVTSCTQLISKRTKLELPFFLVTLPRNEINATIRELTHLHYLKISVEGYSIRGVTQCYKCNNLYHTAANCFMQPRCIKCGKDHMTKDCVITNRIQNPYCINCHVYGHTACYTKCPRFPKPKTGPPTLNRNKNTFNSSNIKENVSFANVVTGNTQNNATPQPPNQRKNRENQSSFPPR
ncbi:nucleic-acid-binding protein from transposon X-element [Trichonephila clavipes]|nr:nucleic-acid-binding protein from transposon X-element [Trichonephila clavipes]